jgi:hypothetical protein
MLLLYFHETAHQRIMTTTKRKKNESVVGSVGQIQLNKLAPAGVATYVYIGICFWQFFLSCTICGLPGSDARLSASEVKTRTTSTVHLQTATSPRKEQSKAEQSRANDMVRLAINIVLTI